VKNLIVLIITNFSALLPNVFPVNFVNITCNWFSALFVSVRWNGEFPDVFHVLSGVRQGSLLSTVFNRFINAFISN
jgi:hypothetical protein